MRLNKLIIVISLLPIFGNCFLLPLSFDKTRIKPKSLIKPKQPFTTDLYLSNINKKPNDKCCKTIKYINNNYSIVDNINYIYYCFLYLYAIFYYNTFLNNNSLMYYDDNNIIFYDV